MLFVDKRRLKVLRGGLGLVHNIFKEVQHQLLELITDKSLPSKKHDADRIYFEDNLPALCHRNSNTERRLDAFCRDIDGVEAVRNQVLRQREHT